MSTDLEHERLPHSGVAAGVEKVPTAHHLDEGGARACPRYLAVAWSFAAGHIVGLPRNSRGLARSKAHAFVVTLRADPRWANMIGGIDAAGRPMPMSVDVLESLVQEWNEVVVGLEPSGALALLDTSRALVVQSWFHYELLVQASFTSLQAVETAFRQQLYPDVNPKTPFMNLVDRADRDAVFDPGRIDAIRAGVKLRNLLAHPEGRKAYSLGQAALILRASHLVVRDICVRSEASAPP